MPRLVDQQAGMSAEVSIFKQQQDITSTGMTENCSAKYRFVKNKLFECTFWLPTRTVYVCLWIQDCKGQPFNPPTDLWPPPCKIDSFSHQHNSSKHLSFQFHLFNPEHAPTVKWKSHRYFPNSSPWSTRIRLIPPWRSTDGNRQC